MNTPSQLDQELEQRLASPLLDVLIRAGLILGLGHALLPGLLPVPDPDGLGADPGRHALSAPPIPGRQDRGQTRTRRNPAGRRWLLADRSADGDADEFAWRFGASTGQRRAEQLAEDSSPASRRRGMADRRQAGSTTFGRRPMRTCRRWCRACSRRSANWRKRPWASSPASVVALLQFMAAFIIAGIIMAFGQSGSRSSRAIFERIVGTDARRRICQTVHGDHSCRRPRGDRGGLYPGHHRRPGLAGRRGSVGGCAGGDRAGPRHRPGAGADRDLARHRLHLVERRLQHMRRRSPTPWCCSCRAWRTTC